MCADRFEDKLDVQRLAGLGAVRHPGQTRTHMATISACNGPSSPFLVSFGGAPQQQVARQLATLPMRVGGVGSPIRVQIEGPSILGILGRGPEGCLGELQEASNVLITVGSWVVHGRSCVWVPENTREPVSGRTVGSISRLPLLNTTSGRPLYLLNRAPLTRPTCVHILCPQSGRGQSRRRGHWRGCAAGPQSGATRSSET